MTDYCLPLLSPLGLTCAFSDALSLDKDCTQEELASFATALREGFLRPVWSASARWHLGLVAIVSVLSACLAATYLCLRLQRHKSGAQPWRWLIAIESAQHGVAHMAEPSLTWSALMGAAALLTAGGSLIDLRGSSPVDANVARHLVVLLFCLTAWLQFPGAVLKCYRMRFHQLTAPVNLLIWLGTAVIFTMLSIALEHVARNWSRAYEDGLALNDALLEATNQWSAVYSVNYTVFLHELENLDTSTLAAAESQREFALLALRCLLVTATCYLSVAASGLSKPRVRPPTPGLGLDFGSAQQQLKAGLAALESPTAPVSMPEGMREEEDEELEGSKASFAQTARARLLSHMSASMIYGLLVAYSLLVVLTSRDDETAGDTDWIWQSTILPGWTHALGTLAINGYLLSTLAADQQQLPVVQLASPPKRATAQQRAARAAQEVATPLRSQVRIELQRSPAVGWMSPSLTKRRRGSRDLQQVIQVM